MYDSGASNSVEDLVVMVMGVVLGYWWWHSCGGSADDSLLKDGRCNTCRRTLMVFVVGFSQGFPGFFGGFSWGFTRVFLGFSQGLGVFPWVFRGFHGVLPFFVCLFFFFLLFFKKTRQPYF